MDEKKINHFKQDLRIERLQQIRKKKELGLNVIAYKYIVLGRYFLEYSSLNRDPSLIWEIKLSDFVYIFYKAAHQNGILQETYYAGRAAPSKFYETVHVCRRCYEAYTIIKMIEARIKAESQRKAGSSSEDKMGLSRMKLKRKVVYHNSKQETDEKFFENLKSSIFPDNPKILKPKIDSSDRWKQYIGKLRNKIFY